MQIENATAHKLLVVLGGLERELGLLFELRRDFERDFLFGNKEKQIAATSLLSNRLFLLDALNKELSDVKASLEKIEIENVQCTDKADTIC